MLSFMVYSFFVVVVYFLMDKGFVSKETVVLRGWGIETNVLFYQQS